MKSLLFCQGKLKFIIFGWWRWKSRRGHKTNIPWKIQAKDAEIFYSCLFTKKFDALEGGLQSLRPFPLGALLNRCLYRACFWKRFSILNAFLGESFWVQRCNGQLTPNMMFNRSQEFIKIRWQRLVTHVIMLHIRWKIIFSL